MVLVVHASLRKHPKKVPYYSVLFFLLSCQKQLRKQPEDTWSHAFVDATVMNVMEHSAYLPPNQTVFDDNIQGLGHHDRITLPLIKNVIQMWRKWQVDAGVAVAEQHGGVLKHGSIQDLTTKVANAPDVTAAAVTIAQYDKLIDWIDKHLHLSDAGN